MGLCLKRSKLFTKQLDLNKSKPITNWPGRNSGAFDAFSIKCSKREKSTVKKSQCLCYNDLYVLLHILYSKKSKKLFKHSWLYCVHLWSLTSPNRPFTLKLASDTSAPPVSTMARRGQNLKWATDWALVGLIQLTRCCIGKKMWLVIFYTQKNVLLLHFLHLMCWHEEKHVTSFCVQSKLDQETHWENESENRKTLIVSGLYQGAWSVALAIRLGSLAWWNSRDAVRRVNRFQECWHNDAATLLKCWRVMPGVCGVTEARSKWSQFSELQRAAGPFTLHKTVWEASLHKNGLFRQIGFFFVHWTFLSSDRLMWHTLDTPQPISEAQTSLRDAHIVGSPCQQQARIKSQTCGWHCVFQYKNITYSHSSQVYQNPYQFRSSRVRISVCRFIILSSLHQAYAFIGPFDHPSFQTLG